MFVEFSDIGYRNLTLPVKLFLACYLNIVVNLKRRQLTIEEFKVWSQKVDICHFDILKIWKWLA